MWLKLSKTISAYKIISATNKLLIKYYQSAQRKYEDKHCQKEFVENNEQTVELELSTQVIDR